MKKTLAIAFAAAFLAAGPVVAADAHHHDDHAAHGAKLQLDNGRKWPSDEPLRKSMTGLRSAFAGKIHAIHTGKLPAEGYRELGGRVDSAVAGIVAECKLEPKADAMLHIVVADLIAGADIMQGRAAGKPMAGAHKAVTALNAYGRHFDHPDWKPLKSLFQ